MTMNATSNLSVRDMENIIQVMIEQEAHMREIQSVHINLGLYRQLRHMLRKNRRTFDNKAQHRYLIKRIYAYADKYQMDIRQQ